MKKAWLFIAGVIIIPMLVFAAVSWYQQKYLSLPFPAPSEHLVKGISAINQDSDTVTFSTIEQKIKVVNLFFTHCPIVCPRMMKNLHSIHDANDNKVVFYSYSVDPERDTAAQLKRYGQRFTIPTSQWHLLTGSKQEIYRFARKGILLLATDGDGGEGDFIHSESVVLIDPEERIRGYYKGTDQKEIQRLAEDIIKLKKELKWL